MEPLNSLLQYIQIKTQLFFGLVRLANSLVMYNYTQIESI